MAVSESYIEPRSDSSGDSGSMSGAFHREWELLKSAPAATVNGVQEKLSSLATHLRRQRRFRIRRRYAGRHWRVQNNVRDYLARRLRFKNLSEHLASQR